MASKGVPTGHTLLEVPDHRRLTSGIGMEEVRVVCLFRTEPGLTLPLPDWLRDLFRCAP
jgi:hypothetical protein